MSNTSSAELQTACAITVSLTEQFRKTSSHTVMCSKTVATKSHVKLYGPPCTKRDHFKDIFPSNISCPGWKHLGQIKNLYSGVFLYLHSKNWVLLCRRDCSSDLCNVTRGVSHDWPLAHGAAHASGYFWLQAVRRCCAHECVRAALRRGPLFTVPLHNDALVFKRFISAGEDDWATGRRSNRVNFHERAYS